MESHHTQQSNTSKYSSTSRHHTPYHTISRHLTPHHTTPHHTTPHHSPALPLVCALPLHSPVGFIRQIDGFTRQLISGETYTHG